MRSCHGSFQGQNGFRLSLFGFEPHLDRKELLETDKQSEGDGPRINLKSPAKSLFLIKPTASAEGHGGGKRMEKGSWQYRLLHAWIEAGAPYDPTKTVKLRRLEIHPPEVVFTDRQQKVQLRAVAVFADGSRENVTGLTVFSSNDSAVAEVTENGQVSVSRTGDTAIVARYAGGVTSAQILVPSPATGKAFPVVYPHNKIDELVVAKLRKLNIHPSKLCSDADFVRRIYLDVIGTLPNAAETRRFLADRSPEKRSRLIDRLLDRPEYAMYWGMKFSDWTGNSKYINNKAFLSNWMWQQWIEDKLARNVAYDEIVYGHVCASSLEGRPRTAFLKEAQSILHKAAGRYNYDDDGTYARRRTNELFWSNVERRNPDTMVLQTANSFLGLRLECAQCHNHPFDRWTQRDFEQFKSFFMTVRYCDPKTGVEKRGGGRGYGVESLESGVSKRYRNLVKKTPPKLLGGSEIPYVEGGSDPRIALWKWMRQPDNPYFAPSFVNRIWHHYFGRGIVDPPDDFNQGNPPSNPQLLNWLAEDFIDHKFDIKHLHRTILNSRVYQLSWQPNASNRLDRKNFSHARLRRMPAEVLIDAIAEVTGVPDNFGRLPKDRPQRAVGQAMPPLRYGATRGGYAMKIFGRPDREKTCDCERSNEPSVAQALYLINDQQVLSKLDDRRGRLQKLLKSIKDDRSLIIELYLTALSRFPTDAEIRLHADHVSTASSRAEGMKDSHIDTWDLKPDAGDKKGEFESIATNNSALRVCEHMPFLAKQADKYAIVRNVSHTQGAHSPGQRYLQTGNRKIPSLEYPDYGSVIAKEHKSPKGVPQYVLMPGSGSNSASYSSGYLGVAYGPFTAMGDPNAKNYSVRALATPAGLTAGKIAARQRLLRNADTRFRDLNLADQNLEGMDKSYQQAFDILQSQAVRKAFRIADESNSLRDRGASIALKHKSAKAVPALRTSLKTRTGDAAVWSAYTLGEIGPPARSAVSDLAAALRSSDSALRAAAARALGKIGPPAATAVKPLAQALSDPQPDVRIGAAVALGQLGPSAKHSAPQLISVLTDPRVRDAARTALVRIGRAAFTSLNTARKNNRVRFDVTQIMLEIDSKTSQRLGIDKTTPDDIPALKTVLNDPLRNAADRTAAANALARLPKKGTPLLIAAFEKEFAARTAAAAFARVGPVAVPALIASLSHRNPAVRSTAADAIGHIGAAASQAAPALIERLSDKDRTVRYHTVRALHTFGKRARPAAQKLIQVINDSTESEPTRQWAIKTLVVTLPDTRDVVVKALIAASKVKGNYGVSQLARQEVRRIDLKAAEAAGAQGNALRSGNAPHVTLPEQLQHAATLTLSDGIYTTPVAGNGLLFAVDGSGVVYAFDAKTLKQVWKFATPGGKGNCNNVASPALIGNYLHVGTTAGYYYIFKCDTGEIVNRIDCADPIFASPAVGKRRVYFATLGARVYAVEPDGTLAWTWDFVKEVIKFDGDRWSGADWTKHRNGRVTWRDHFVCSRDICLIGKTVVMPAGGRTVFLDDDGNKPRVRSVAVIPRYAGSEYPATFGQSADDKGNVYVQWHRRDNAGRVEKLRLDGDTLKTDYVKGTETSIRIHGLLSFAPVSVRGSDVYRVRPQHGFGLCRHTDGETEPKVLCEAASICSPVLTKHHAVYGGLDGKLYVVPLEGGKARSFAFDNPAPITAPVAIAGGRVYVPCENGSLYILAAKSIPQKNESVDPQVWKIRSPLTGPLAGPEFDWYTNYGDHRGSNANDQGLQAPLRMRWARRVSGTVKHLPVCGGGRLYTHTAEGQIVAVEQDTGRLLSEETPRGLAASIIDRCATALEKHTPATEDTFPRASFRCAALPEQHNMSVAAKLKELDIELPKAPAAVGAYVPVLQTGNLVITSGQLPFVGKELAFKGKVGAQLHEQEGIDAARLCAINALAQIKSCIGDLERIRRVVKLEGYVHSAPGFTNQPQVLNGASQLFVDLFGERGKHTRTALGISEMPLSAAVQLAVWVEVEQAESESDRHGVERLVKYDRQKRPDPQRQPARSATAGAVHTRRQRDSVDQRMNREPGGNPHPAHRVVGVTAADVAVVVIVVVMFVPRRKVARLFGRLGNTVIVKMKRPNQEEHRQDAHHHPEDAEVGRADILEGMRQHMEDPDAQHQPPDETDNQLHPRVRQRDDQRQRPSTDRRQAD
eukprot:g26734.t1